MTTFPCNSSLNGRGRGASHRLFHSPQPCRGWRPAFPCGGVPIPTTRERSPLHGSDFTCSLLFWWEEEKYFLPHAQIPSWMNETVFAAFNSWLDLRRKKCYMLQIPYVVGKVNRVVGTDSSPCSLLPIIIYIFFVYKKLSIVKVLELVEVGKNTPLNLYWKCFCIAILVILANFEHFRRC